MTRCDWCMEKEHVEKLKIMCGKGDENWRILIRAIEFVDEHPTFVGFSEGALRPLIREKNEEVKSKIIKLVAKGGERKGELYGTQKKMKAAINLEKRQKVESAQLPEGKYQVIVIDPPWRYDNQRRDDPTHRGDVPYPDMSIEEIERLPILDLAGEDCILWLWATNAFMHDAFHLIDRWGFTQKTILTWKKHKMGLGIWLRGITEHCLLAVKGKPSINLTNQTTFLEGQVREHSRKPEEFFDLVNKLCIGKKLEFFARQTREGWNSYGNEITKFGGK